LIPAKKRSPGKRLKALGVTYLERGEKEKAVCEGRASRFLGRRLRYAAYRPLRGKNRAL